MTVVPRCAVLSDSKLVRIVISRSNWALSDGVDSVMFEGVEESDPMPVNGCAIIFQMVFDGDFYPVTPASLEPRSRILAIENFTTVRPVDAISVDVLICDVQVVLLDSVKIGKTQGRGCCTIACITYLSDRSDGCKSIVVGENIVYSTTGIIVPDRLFEPGSARTAASGMPPSLHRPIVTHEARTSIGWSKDRAIW